MAKVSLTKLGLKINQEIKTIEWDNHIIEIKQYIPVEKKLSLFSDIINFTAEDKNFVNPIKVEIYLCILIIENYTNITFTEKQKENIYKLYDCFLSTGLMDQILNNMPIGEYEKLKKGIEETIASIYSYKNSFIGLMEEASTDYSNLALDASLIQKDLSDPESMSLLKDILKKIE